ncbi:MAG TPA: ribonuclease III domain-containing protein [Oscillospiraceae bacterium]|nr:ribonuclease III domain-containing protein [Oscillospiraceae bacterium]HPK34932.1 ribonuclease III domain-containing protein [Oscillospiraceae bacterium]HPR75359.1 ribonuclease III domain-containing protein [Oscillospiraceae bacterium]
MTLNSSMSDNRFFEPVGSPDQMPVSKLAFLGDAVYELIVREQLVESAEVPFEKLNDLKQEFVKATAQAEAAKQILPLLTEKEELIYRHGRNAKHKNAPKSASLGEYSKATGFEALLGYLWLSGQKSRIMELVEVIREK